MKRVPDVNLEDPDEKREALDQIIELENRAAEEHKTTKEREYWQGRKDGLRLALPCRNDNKSNREKSLKMALYMLRNGLKGLWFLQQLSPGYAPLMPFMIADRDGRTVSQLWAESSVMKNLLPRGGSEFIIEGDILE